MSAKSQQTPFIVSTLDHGGAWYKEKKATLSLINAHVARNKKVPATRLEKRSQARDLHFRTRNSHQLLREVAPADGTDCVNHGSHIHPEGGISLLGLQAIFADTVSVNGEDLPRVEQTLAHRQSPTAIHRYTNSRSAVTYQHIQFMQQTSWKVVRQETYAVRPMSARVFEPKSNFSLNLRGGFVGQPLQNEATTSSWSLPPKLPMRVNGGQSWFSSLAIEVSATEKELLHFFMAKGRRMVFGTAAAPAFCPVISTFMSGMLQTNPVFVTTHIVMAEFMFSKLRSTQLSENFYRRRASTYRSVVALTSDANSTLRDQIEAILLLSLVEHTMGRPDLQLYHLRAMHELIETNGGLRSFLQETTTDLRTYYSAHYTFSEFQIPRNSPAATEVILTFVAWLQKIQAWKLRHMYSLTSSESTSCDDNVAILRTYLSIGIYRHLRDFTTSYFPGSGFFYILFNLCATMTEWTMELRTTRAFLGLLQDRLVQSADDDNTAGTSAGNLYKQGIHRFHPNVLAPPIPYIAYSVQASQPYAGTLGESEETSVEGRKETVEVAVTEASINAMKAFSLLSASARLRISQGLLDCCMIDRDPNLVQCFPESELADLVSEAH